MEYLFRYLFVPGLTSTSCTDYMYGSCRGRTCIRNVGSEDYQSFEVIGHIVVGLKGMIPIILRLGDALTQARWYATPVHEYLMSSFPLSMWENDGALNSGPSGRINSHEADMTTYATNCQYQQPIFIW